MPLKAQVIPSDSVTINVTSTGNVGESPAPIFTPQDNCRWREPGISFLLSFLVPGGGQFYNDQYGKGAIMLGTYAIGLGVLINSLTPYRVIDGQVEYFADGVPFAVGFLLTLSTWLWSIIDAPITANRLNEKNGITFKLEPNLQMNIKGQFTLGPKISFRF